MRYSTLFVLVVAALDSGCGAKLPSVKPFKMEIQQGNVVTSKMLLQLRPGMTRSQVRYIMGTPLIVDSFRDNRWDYFYELRKEGVVVEKRRVILDFDKDALVSVRGDVVPAGDPAAAADAPVTAKVKEPEAAWTDKLKFWKDGEKAASAESPAKTAIAPVAATPELLKSEVAPTSESDASIAPAQSAVPVEAATSAVADPTPAPLVAEPAPVLAEEVVPLIPEGEFVAAPETTVKGDMTADAAKVEEAQSVPVNKEAAQSVSVKVEQSAPVAAKTAEAAAIPEKMTEPVIVAEQTAEPVVVQEPMPPLVETVPASTSKVVKLEAAPAAVAPNQIAELKTTSPVEVAKDSKVAVTAAATTTAKTLALSQGAKPLFKKPGSTSQVTTVNKSQPSQKAVVPPASVEPALNTMEDDEVVPFIPEGEYVEPVIPTPEEMEKGNLDAEATKQVDAETKTVTEKGMAPANVTEHVAEPVFVQDAQPEVAAEPEPELPLPPKAAPVVAPAMVNAEPEPKKIADTNASVSTPAQQTTETSQAPVGVIAGNNASRSVAAQQAVVAAKTEVVSADAPSGNASIEYAVLVWADAWRKKDVSRYLAAYANDFVPDGMPNKKAWESQRKQRLSAKQGEITLDIGALDIQRNGNQASVSFNQKYAAKAYHDELNKTLQLRYSPAQKTWLITRESVQTTPVVAAVAAAPAPVVVTEEKTAVSSVVAAPAVAMPATTDAQSAAPLATRSEPAQVETGDADVEVAVQAWAQAWRSKNVAAYFAAYATDFMPDGLPSKRAWEAQRKQRLSAKQGQITLEIGQLNIQRNGEDAVVTFNQKYAARSYKDEMQKKLQLRYNADLKSWLIVRESATVISGASTSKQQVTAPEGSAEHLDGVLEQIGF